MLVSDYNSDFTLYYIIPMQLEDNYQILDCHSYIVNISDPWFHIHRAKIVSKMLVLFTF